MYIFAWQSLWLGSFRRPVVWTEELFHYTYICFFVYQDIKFRLLNVSADFKFDNVSKSQYYLNLFERYAAFPATYRSFKYSTPNDLAKSSKGTNFVVWAISRKYILKNAFLWAETTSSAVSILLRLEGTFPCVLFQHERCRKDCFKQKTYTVETE